MRLWIIGIASMLVAASGVALFLETVNRQQDDWQRGAAGLQAEARKAGQ